MEFSVENWFDCKEDMAKLFPLHWEEIADQRIPLDVWYEQYDRIAEDGQLHIVTIRDKDTCGACQKCENAQKGKLIGYYWAIVRPHLHYQQSLTAYTDIYFIHPEHRKGMLGVNLFKFAEQSLKERGVQRMYIASKTKLDMSLIFERLNFSKTEIVYTKLIGE